MPLSCQYYSSFFLCVRLASGQWALEAAAENPLDGDLGMVMKARFSLGAGLLSEVDA